MEIQLTENSYIYQSAKRLLEQSFDNCMKKLKSTEKAWNEYIDLKLHDASWTNVDFDFHGASVVFGDTSLQFEAFCQIEYDTFIEWCNEKGYDFDSLRDNIGRTSSFYLGKLHSNSGCHYLDALVEASSSLNYDTRLVVDEIDGKFVVNYDASLGNSEDIEDLVNAMLSLVEDMEKELDDTLDAICSIYEYINDFKENQVENFKEFCKEDWLANV